MPRVLCFCTLYFVALFGLLFSRGLKVIDRNDLKPQLISGEGKRSRLMDTIGVTRGFGDHDIEYLYLPGLKIRPFMLPDAEV